ncbi:unnamed protein product [Linum trigynum]|uniref:Uncharacterized protein n=1 Tax=Linum trigynum TaxID=586398 RepID=A0AAV2F862_9ROSI
MRLLCTFGLMQYIEGLSPDPEVPPPAEQPPARAPGPRQRPALQRLAQPPPPATGDPLVQRVDRLETNFVGFSSRLDRQSDILELIPRRHGILPDEAAIPLPARGSRRVKHVAEPNPFAPVLHLLP